MFVPSPDSCLLIVTFSNDSLIGLDSSCVEEYGYEESYNGIWVTTIETYDVFDTPTNPIMWLILRSDFRYNVNLQDSVINGLDVALMIKKVWNIKE